MINKKKPAEYADFLLNQLNEILKLFSCTVPTDVLPLLSSVPQEIPGL